MTSEELQLGRRAVDACGLLLLRRLGALGAWDESPDLPGSPGGLARVRLSDCGARDWLVDTLQNVFASLVGQLPQHDRAGGDWMVEWFFAL